MSLAAGAKLGPYTIVAPLGAGGMGEVYRARDERLGRDVAIKVLPERVRTDRDRLRRFEVEARAAGALSHPSILAVHDFQVDGEIPYLVTELLEGSTLRDLLASRSLSWRRALELAIPLASGLAAAHERGIIHRDLKPENVFVLRDGRVKILDFGLAKSLTNEASAIDAATGPSGARVEATLSSDGHTATGAILGSAGYMSPEQVQGRPADHRADVFAFGAVLYEMIAGRRAFLGETPVEKAYAILRDDPPELPPSVPRALADVVRRCLAKEPAQRFQSAGDLVFVLGALANEPEPTATAAPAAAPQTAAAPPAAQPKKPRTGLARFAPLALAALVGAAIPGVFSSDRSDRSDRTEHVDPAIPPPSPPSEAELSQLRVLSAMKDEVAKEITPEDGARLAVRVLTRELKKAKARERNAKGGGSAEALELDVDGPRYAKLTFRRGLLHQARFAPDGKSVVYTQSCGDGVAHTEVVVPGNPESRRLLDPGPRLFAISKTGELALGMGGPEPASSLAYVPLGRAPLSGGAPRLVATDVAWADWDPDGRELAVVRGPRPLELAENFVEHPVGKRVYETHGWITSLRVSPTGEHVAFLDHPTPGDDAGSVAVIGPDGAVKHLGPTWGSASGLAWDPGGEEIWFTATTGFSRSLWAVSLDGEVRALASAPANLTLLDVASDGRALVKSSHAVIDVSVLAPGFSEPRDLGWFDVPDMPIVSADHKVLITTEWSEATRGVPTVYMRALDESAAVALGEGFALDVSRDGRTVLALSPKREWLTLLPTGPGKARHLTVEGVAAITAARFRSGEKEIALLGRRATGALAFFVQDVASGAVRPVGPDAVEALAGSAIIAPSGTRAIARLPGGGPALVTFDGALPRTLPDVSAVEEIAGWSSDERAVFVLRRGEPPAAVDKVDLATGKATRLRNLLPERAAGRWVREVSVSADGRVLAWKHGETDETLYLVEGLR